MEIIGQSLEQEPAVVDISTLKVGDRFTVVNNPKDPEDEVYIYQGRLPGPGGTMHGFMTVRKFEVESLLGGLHIEEKQKIWQIIGEMEVIKVPNND